MLRVSAQVGQSRSDDLPRRWITFPFTLPPFFLNGYGLTVRSPFFHSIIDSLVRETGRCNGVESMELLGEAGRISTIG